MGFLLDAVLGDPRRGHPVAAYGTAVGWLERRVYADRRAAGAGFALLAVGAPLVVAAALDRGLRGRPGARLVATALTTWTVLGGRSLTRAGAGLGSAVAAGDLSAARALVPTLVGRDPASLDLAGVARATVESLAENTSDAVVGPLVWGAVAGLPGLVGYRAVNTLDAMVGHRSERYARFGTAAARLDDVANLVPARLTGLLTLAAAPLVGGRVRDGARAWRRDARGHPSPNAGVCEASAAGVLGVRLGGPTAYGDRVEQRPWLGDGPSPTAATVGAAVRLSRAVQIAALGVGVGLSAVLGEFQRRAHPAGLPVLEAGRQGP